MHGMHWSWHFNISGVKCTEGIATYKRLQQECRFYLSSSNHKGIEAAATELIVKLIMYNILNFPYYIQKLLATPADSIFFGDTCGDINYAYVCNKSLSFFSFLV